MNAVELCDRAFGPLRVERVRPEGFAGDGGPRVMIRKPLPMPPRHRHRLAADFTLRTQHALSNDW